VTVDPKRKIGPNLKKLMAHKMAIDMIPPGGDPFAFVETIMDGKKHAAIAGAALEWAILAVNAVRSAIDNPYGDDEEAIAGEILKQIEERKRADMIRLRKR
jgi:predicted membrane chloride channel (bestrophin family)